MLMGAPVLFGGLDLERATSGQPFNAVVVLISIAAFAVGAYWSYRLALTLKASAAR